MSADKLLPCPWCAGINLEVRDDGFGRFNYSAECQNVECNARGPSMNTPDEAMAAWFDRAPVADAEDAS